MRVVTEAMPHARSVAIGAFVGTGSRDEPASMAGASHFLEHLVFKGTPTRTGRAISEAIDAVGGDMDAATSRESTVFHARVLAEDLDLALDLVCDTVWNPLLTPADVDIERQVILEEIDLHLDEPSDLVHEAWAAACFPGHGLGRETLGDEHTVAALDAASIRAFHDEHYRPANIVVAAAGRIDHQAFVAGLAQRVGHQRPGGSPPVRHDPTIGPEGLALIEDDTEQVHLVLGVRGLAADDPQRHALAVLDHALGGGLSSRLWQQVREERGLAYSVYSDRNHHQGVGTLACYVGTAPEHLDEVLCLVRSTFDDIAANGITPDEVRIAIGHLVGELALSMEDSGARMSRIGRGLQVHGVVRSLDEVVASLRAVSIADVAAVAERVLSRPRVLAVVGPVDAAALA